MTSPILFDVANVQSKLLAVSLYNSLGGIVFRKDFEGLETLYGNVKLETATLPKGAYVYRVEHNGEVASTGTIVK